MPSDASFERQHSIISLQDPVMCMFPCPSCLLVELHVLWAPYSLSAWQSPLSRDSLLIKRGQPVLSLQLGDNSLTGGWSCCSVSFTPLVLTWLSVSVSLPPQSPHIPPQHPGPPSRSLIKMLTALTNKGEQNFRSFEVIVLNWTHYNYSLPWYVFGGWSGVQNQLHAYLQLNRSHTQRTGFHQTTQVPLGMWARAALHN